MKKLVLVAGLFMAFATHAQQRNDGFRNTKVEYRQSPGDFYGVRLTQSQQRKIDALSRERLSQKAYDAKIRKILTREQYAKYASNSYKSDKKIAFRNSARR